ncbi:MAG: uroporphyrinogen-III C-methyltransferase [Pseudomonadota bacterium]
MRMQGRVCLVGAGPGDPDLLTVKALRRIAEAEALVYDRLVSPEILALRAPTARMVAVGKAPGCHTMSQSRINQTLIDLSRSGLRVVRLKGGDPFIFGRGSEEAAELRAAGIPVEVVPGITAAQGAAASSGVPLTHRGLATGVRYVTGHRQGDGRLDLDWQGLADPDTTLVLYMGMANIAEIAAALIAHGLDPEMPAMAVASATTPLERRRVSRLGRLAAEMASGPLSGPVLFIIGRVVAIRRTCPQDIRAWLKATSPASVAHA